MDMNDYDQVKAALEGPFKPADDDYRPGGEFYGDIYMLSESGAIVLAGRWEGKGDGSVSASSIIPPDFFSTVQASPPPREDTVFMVVDGRQYFTKGGKVYRRNDKYLLSDTMAGLRHADWTNVVGVTVTEKDDHAKKVFSAIAGAGTTTEIMVCNQLKLAGRVFSGPFYVKGTGPNPQRSYLFDTDFQRFLLLSKLPSKLTKPMPASMMMYAKAKPTSGVVASESVADTTVNIKPDTWNGEILRITLSKNGSPYTVDGESKLDADHKFKNGDRLVGFFVADYNPVLPTAITVFEGDKPTVYKSDSQSIVVDTWDSESGQITKFRIFDFAGKEITPALGADALTFMGEHSSLYHFTESRPSPEYTKEIIELDSKGVKDVVVSSIEMVSGMKYAIDDVLPDGHMIRRIRIPGFAQGMAPKSFEVETESQSVSYQYIKDVAFGGFTIPTREDLLKIEIEYKNMSKIMVAKLRSRSAHMLSRVGEMQDLHNSATSIVSPDGIDARTLLNTDILDKDVIIMKGA